MRISSKYYIYILEIIVLTILIYFIHKNISEIMEILTPILISTILAYLINPFVQYFETKGLKKVPSILLVYALILLIMILAIFFILPLVFNEISNLLKMLPKYIDELLKNVDNAKIYYSKLLPKGFELLLNKRIESLNTIAVKKLDILIQELISLSTHILDLIVTPIITFYVLKDKDILKNELKEIIPESKKSTLLRILKDLDNVMSKYIRGQIYISLFVTLLTSIGLMIIKVRYSIVIGIIAGVLNIIPYFGPILGAIPAVTIGLIDSFYKGIWAFIIFFLVQQVESAILAPKIMSDSVDLHPITVIITLLVGEQFFGIWGLLFSLPVVAMIKVILKDILIEI